MELTVPTVHAEHYRPPAGALGCSSAACLRRGPTLGEQMSPSRLSGSPSDLRRDVCRRKNNEPPGKPTAAVFVMDTAAQTQHRRSTRLTSWAFCWPSSPSDLSQSPVLPWLSLVGVPADPTALRRQGFLGPRFSGLVGNILVSCCEEAGTALHVVWEEMSGQDQVNHHRGDPLGWSLQLEDTVYTCLCFQAVKWEGRMAALLEMVQIPGPSGPSGAAQHNVMRSCDCTCGTSYHVAHTSSDGGLVETSALPS